MQLQMIMQAFFPPKQCFQTMCHLRQHGTQWPETQPDTAVHAVQPVLGRYGPAAPDHRRNLSLDLSTPDGAFDLLLVVSHHEKIIPTAAADPVKDQDTALPPEQYNVPPAKPGGIFLFDDHLIPPRHQQGIHAVALGLDTNPVPFL